MIPMYAFYTTFAFLVLLVAWGGVEETMRLFAYLDLHLRFSWVRFRLWMMRRKLEQQLLKDLPEFNQLMKEKKENGE
tara:strand:+ start:1330 stop:1560 length:231 start_codon:yes stop_codon:yes gene_type:complete